MVLFTEMLLSNCDNLSSSSSGSSPRGSDHPSIHKRCFRFKEWVADKFSVLRLVSTLRLQLPFMLAPMLPRPHRLQLPSLTMIQNPVGHVFLKFAVSENRSTVLHQVSTDKP